MNIIDLLNERKSKLLEESGDLRKKLFEIIDENSFVELNAYSFANNEFYSEDANSLGVITGYATINEYPVYVVAQNAKVLNGGLSKANCDKIVACLKKAIGTETAVVYLLDTQGVQVGEGVAVLEGIASVLALSNDLKDVAPQVAVAIGDVYGSFALLANNADYTFVVGNNCVSYASPSVISASSKNLMAKESIGGNKSINGVKTFAVKDLSEVKDGITKVFGVLPQMSGLVVDTDDDLNRSNPALNEKACANCLINSIYDKDTFVKMYEGYADEVIVGVGRIGGIATAGIIFDGGEEGVELTLSNVLKIKNFASFVADNGLPTITLVNTKGIKIDACTASTPIMVEVMNMLYNLSNNGRISVVYGKAIGLGYTAFASRNFGNTYTFAFANAKISLLDGETGVAATFGTVDNEKITELSEKYGEMQDAFNAAKLGCVDNIIEPEFVRQYVISALQTLVR